MRESSESSAGSSGSHTPSSKDVLLPKLNNAKVFQDTTTKQQSRQERGRKTNSNIFVEEPDTFIVPGQPVQHPRRERTPEDIPLKPPFSTPPMLEGVDDSTPIKPLPPPPPIPPKTYIKIKFDTEHTPKQSNNSSNSSTSGAPRVEPGVREVVVEVEPKQSNIERAKGVRFHTNVKFPVEDEPPPLPSRDHVDSEEVGLVRNAIMIETTGPISAISIEDTTRSRRDLKIPLANKKESEKDTTGTGEFKVAIVTKEGIRVGEMIPSPSSSPVTSLDETRTQHSDITSDDVFLSNDQIVSLPNKTSESQC